MSIVEPNPSAQAAFQEKMTEVLNHASLALMMSIGHRTGLFDAMYRLPEATSDAIAASAGMNERYVREWLNGMVVGGIVTFDQEFDSYTLPAEHGALLSRHGKGNAAIMTQAVSVLGGVEDAIVRCFKEGGGVPYAAYDRLHEVMDEQSTESVVKALCKRILPLADGLVERLEEGIDVLDMGCGRGHLVMEMARRYPKSRFTGQEVSERAIGLAQQLAAEAGLKNVTFEARKPADFRDSDRYDLITVFEVIHNQPDPNRILRSIHLSLAPGGVYLMQDIKAHTHVDGNLDHPNAAFLYTLSCMHCMAISLDYNGEGTGSLWGEELALEMLRQAGFSDIEIKSVSENSPNHFYVCRK